MKQKSIFANARLAEQNCISFKGLWPGSVIRWSSRPYLL